MEILVKAYENESLEALDQLFRESDIYERYFQNGLLKTMERAAGSKELYVAYADGRLAGAMWISARGFCGLYPYLKLIGVGKDYRSCGVGAVMLEFFENLGRSQGARKLSLMVSDFNDAGQRFYLRHGFYALGKIENASRDGIGEIVMLKDLE